MTTTMERETTLSRAEFFKRLGITRSTWHIYVRLGIFAAPPRLPGATVSSGRYIIWTPEYLRDCQTRLKRYRAQIAASTDRSR